MWIECRTPVYLAVYALCAACFLCFVFEFCATSRKPEAQNKFSKNARIVKPVLSMRPIVLSCALKNCWSA